MYNYVRVHKHAHVFVLYRHVLCFSKAGLEENLELYGLIAGLWGAVYALGYVHCSYTCTCTFDSSKKWIKRSPIEHKSH